jgi:hypothetical protein
MSTRPAKDRVGLKLPFPPVVELVVEEPHPAIRRPRRMSRPTPLRQLALQMRFSASWGSVVTACGFLFIMIMLFLSSEKLCCYLPQAKSAW